MTRYIYSPAHTPPRSFSEGIQIEAVNLYLDKETRRVFEAEANRVELSFSAYLRVVARAFNEWGKSEPHRSMEDLREAVHRIVDEESRRI